MRVEGAYTFPGEIERVFATITNPDALARAIPGCERFIQLGPASAHGDIRYEVRLRSGTAPQPYTITLDVTVARRPAYLKLEIGGHGPAGPIAGSGSLDLVEQEDHTVAAYRFIVGGPGAPETSDAPSQAASFVARATCAHLADEIIAETDEFAWEPERAVRSRAASGVRLARPGARASLAWTERAIWLSVGLAMGLGAIALAVGVVRWLGGRGVEG